MAKPLMDRSRFVLPERTWLPVTRYHPLLVLCLIVVALVVAYWSLYPPAQPTSPLYDKYLLIKDQISADLVINLLGSPNEKETISARDGTELWTWRDGKGNTCTVLVIHFTVAGRKFRGPGQRRAMNN
jgi:hypothetical protein